MYYEIDIFNQTHDKINKAYLKKISAKILDILEPNCSCALSIVFCSKKDIRILNKNYRGVDKVTDVLSFGILDKKREKIDNPDKVKHLGDIWICAKIVKKQSKMKSHSFNLEIVILLIHSMLHLFGYHHDNKIQKHKMDSLAKNILKRAY